MSLGIDKLTLDGFRGYTHLSLAELGMLTIFVGPNAVGKTNLIEGIQLLTSAESFRKPSWADCVSWGSDTCRISAHLADGTRSIDHVMYVKDGKRTYEVNGKRKTASAVCGTCPAVLFTPDDLQMLKASSAVRRDALDALGSQLSSRYGALRHDYQQALKQRNLLIRDGVHEGLLFASWDESVAVNGGRLCVNRWRLARKLAAHMQSIYAQIACGETLELRYLPSWSRFDESGRQMPVSSRVFDETEIPSPEEVSQLMLDASKRLADIELARHMSLVGPQKDEIAFYINGRLARSFASQGQQRTVVLAYKLAEVELVNELLGCEPVLLLDDVMSELDERHRHDLTSKLTQASQTFITTTNLGYFSDDLLEKAHVIELPIAGTRRNEKNMEEGVRDGEN